MDVQVGACQSRLSLLSLLSLLRERDAFLDEVVQAGDAESQWKAIQVSVTLRSCVRDGKESRPEHSAGSMMLIIIYYR